MNKNYVLKTIYNDKNDQSLVLAKVLLPDWSLVHSSLRGKVRGYYPTLAPFLASLHALVSAFVSPC